MALALSGFPSLLPPKSSIHQFSASSCDHAAFLSRKPLCHPCICCTAQQSADDGPSPSSSASKPHSWQPDGSRPDSFAGWSFVDGSNNNKRKKLTGFLQVGAGVALAVGFAAVSHAFSKRGLGTVVVPAPTIYEETILKEEPTKGGETDESVAAAEEEEAAPHVKADEIADEPVPETLQQRDAPTTGQVSLPSDKIEEVSDGVSPPAASAGAASTFGHETAGEVYADNESGGTETGEELPSPTNTTAETVSDELSSDSPAEAENNPVVAAGETGIDTDVLKSGGAAAADTDSPVVSDETPEAEDGAGGIYSESGSSAPETSPADDASAVSTDLPVPSMKPVVLVISEVPVDDGGQALVASVVGGSEMAEVLKCEVPAQLAEEVEVVVSLSSLPQDEISSPSKVGASPVDNAAAPDADDLSRVTPTLDKVSPSSESELWQLTSVVLPAPSAPSALASGRVLIPPVVDHAQEQAVAALQSLKVVEPGVGAADMCTRREYARWLVAANRTLAKSTAAKIVPAMYIEKVTEIAFDDVSPSDPDFPFIQGLAEAGLISSKLSQDTDDGSSVDFLPDRPLSRQDLLSWKLALEHHSLPVVDRNKLQEKTGFIDVDQIHKDAWPSVAADFSAGDRSIMASAFGYTRRFQPHKPVTTGQAAVALVSGDALEQVSEELERLEAEKLAEKAVAAEIALEARAQKEANAVFQEELELQKQMTAGAEARAETFRAELEQLKLERENEKLAILKERASLEAAKETLSLARLEVDGLLQRLSSEKVQVVFERGRLEKLLVEIEEERDSLGVVKSETEVEKKALALAREWAEEEAKKARAHAKVLEEARKRWETQGIEVHVDKDLADTNIPVPSWQFNGDKFELEKSRGKAPMQEMLAKADEYKGKSLQFLKQALDTSNEKVGIVQQRILSSVGEITRKAQEVQQSTFFVVRSKAGEARGAAASMASGISAVVAENTHKFADGCRGSAEKLAQIFKS